MKYVDEHTPLIVGQRYKVRCAELRSGWNDVILTYIPIIGEAHRDPQFNAGFPHYHVDGRFVRNTKHMKVDDRGRTNVVLHAGKNTAINLPYVSAIVVQRRTCYRLTTGLNVSPEWPAYNKWYDSMLGKSCRGRRCPHLGTVMHERAGQLVCPLHDLRGCITNEIIIPRV